MNRSEFLEVIKNGGLGVEDTAGLDELVMLYPWFQSAYSVILNDLFRSGSFNFEERLKKSAIYIADREVLYYLLNDKIKIGELVGTVQGNPEQKSANVPAGDRTREELIDEINRRLSEIEEEKSEETILHIEDEAVDSVYDDEPETQKPLHGFGNELLDLDYPEDTENSYQSSTDIEIDVESESSILDRFMETNPRMEAKADTSVDQLEDITKNIDDREEGLVSETLARIYLSQKYYTKAILIYEKLSLKYPEKSSYFAAQIEKIKELIS